MIETYREILNKIVEYDSIVIARHIGADPDALGSQLGLKTLINELYPEKKVYAVGTIASKFRFMGSTDRIDNVNCDNSFCGECHSFNRTDKKPVIFKLVQPSNIE